MQFSAPLKLYPLIKTKSGLAVDSRCATVQIDYSRIVRLGWDIWSLCREEHQLSYYCCTTGELECCAWKRPWVPYVKAGVRRICTLEGQARLQQILNKSSFRELDITYFNVQYLVVRTMD